MSDPPSLTSSFLAPLETSVRVAITDRARAAIEESLRALYDAARAAWPGIALAAERFAAHLARHMPPEAEPRKYLAEVNASDLYLACACMHGVPAALECFDRTVLGKVPSFVGRIDRSPAFTEDVRQELREKLLVASANHPPKIGEFAGTGALAAWVRVAAVRAALNLRRNRDDQPHENLDERVIERAVERNPEMEQLRVRYRADFQSALQDSFAALSREERNILRLHFAAGLTGDHIASLLKVSRSTVVRRLTSVREAILRETRRLLSERLRLTASELDNLIHVVRSQLDLSLNTMLKTRDESEP